jgi:hypothetical protein
MEFSKDQHEIVQSHGAEYFVQNEKKIKLILNAMEKYLLQKFFNNLFMRARNNFVDHS